MNPIPPATAAKIATPFPMGERHKAKLEIAIPLLANGLSASAVFVTLREKFPQANDTEINGVIQWVQAHHFTPTTGGNGYRPKRSFPREVPPAPNRTPLEQVDWWTHGAAILPESVVSPVAIPAAQDVLGALFKEDDCLNVICRFFEDKGKARPIGPGKTLTVNEWRAFIQAKGVPQSNAGAWVRINPCKPVGSGKDGAITDTDITRFCYVLVESDVLPIPKQLACYLKWRLPIAALILSGGASVHAWVKVDCRDATAYDALARRFLESIKPFGFDESNKNPSRLCRLPGAKRIIGAVDGGEQRLLYLNPACSPLTEESLTAFQQTLAFPCVVERPLQELTEDAISRYEWMLANVGKLGVPSGIPKVDYLSGGWKKGQTIVIAGKTGGGKTTLALHMIVAALRAGHGVALFSLEMDREEIFDLLVASQCKIDRNKFNNGRFTEHDLAGMVKGFDTLSKWPLWIEDSALSNTEQIKARVMQLKAEDRISLVVVDYVQFVNPDWTRETREQQVAHISHDLRALAREAHLPMIVLSQLNEDGQLRESRVIAHNSNVVMGVDLEGDKCKVTITKGRGIPCGEYVMEFDRIHAKIIPAMPEEVTGQAPPPYPDP